MINEKEEKLTKMINEFCDEYLNDEYKETSQKIIEKMANEKNVRFKKEKLEVWASAIIYAVCQINSLFDESNEIHITRKDIFNYFNTTQPIVSRKAINLRNRYNLDKKFSPDITDKADLEEILKENIEENIFGEDYPNDYDMTIEDCQKVIDDYEQKFGKEYFKENEGVFWLIPETRPYMQCLFDQAQLLWIEGEKEKAIAQYKYMLKLNPNDNQGVRDSLLPNLLELNRLDEAEDLYFEYKDDFTANWKFGKLLLDIKNNVSYDKLKIEYEDCVESNPYIIPYLLGDKEFPNEIPAFYGIGDENEAIFYVLLASSAWHSDEKSMKILKKLSEK